jgi:hypothetical protein
LGAHKLKERPLHQMGMVTGGGENQKKLGGTR